MADWQPIETAPRDGSPALVYCDGYYIAMWHDGYKMWEDDEGNNLFPTHWQPLPAPPQETEQ